jgi:hypothetical protein
MNPRNLIDFLTSHDAAALSALRTEYPSTNTVWRRDRDLGEPNAPAGDVPLIAALRLVTVGIETLRERANSILLELTRRLNRRKTQDH